MTKNNTTIDHQYYDLGVEEYSEEEVLYKQAIYKEWESVIHNYKEVPVEQIQKLTPASDNSKSPITPELMKELLFRPCRNITELQNWIKTFIKVDLPDTTIDPTSNSNPLDIVWRLYRTSVWYEETPPEERLVRSIIYAARGSMKTLSATIAELMIMLHTSRDVVHCALILSQAKNAYNKYFRPFLDLPYVKEYAKISSILEKSIIQSNYKLDKIEKNKENELLVIPCTLNATSGPRAQVLVFDEIDKAKGEQLQAYQNAYGMRTATNDKELPITFGISTRDSAFGLVQDEIDSADKKGTKIFHWNIIDITEKCPDERSGVEPVKLYIKKETLYYITEEQYNKLPTTEKREYEMEWGLDGCWKNCKIFAGCKSYLKNQNSKSKWLKTIEDTQQAILSAPSEDMAIAQLLCKKPPSTGLVYSDFTKSKNVKTASQIYKIFMGIDEDEGGVDENMTIEDMIEIFMEYEIPIFMGVDAGFRNPAALLVAIDKQENIYVLKEYRPNMVDSQELAHHLSENWGHYWPDKVFSDPESPDCSSALKKKKFKVSQKVDKAVQLGIATMKGFIRLPGTNKTKMFVHRDCKKTIKEMGQKYKYKENSDGTYSDDPVKNHDHSCVIGDTIIHTTNGDHKIEDLIGKEGEVYCYDHEKGQISAGKFWNVHKKNTKKDVYRVNFEGGGSIEATADHKFLTRFGGYKELKDLCVEESLMPFYRSYDVSGHQKIRLNNGLIKSSHQIVWESFNGKVDDPWTNNIHHKDFNKMNNSLENLQLVTRSEHARIHKNGIKLSKEHKDKIRISWDEKIKANPALKSRLVDSMGHARKFATLWHKSEKGIEWYRNNLNGAVTKEFQNQMKKTIILKNCKYCSNEFETNKLQNNSYCSGFCKNKKRTEDHSVEKVCLECNNSFVEYKWGKVKFCSRSCSATNSWKNERKKEKSSLLNKKCGLCNDEFTHKAYQKRKYCSKSCGAKANNMKRKGIFNHKIESIEYVGKKDVYDMSVDKHNNYAANGVIIHNCDALRYILHTIFGQAKAQLFADTLKAKEYSKKQIIKDQLKPSSIIKHAYGNMPLIDNREEFLKKDKDGNEKKRKKKKKNSSSSHDFTKF